MKLRDTNEPRGNERTVQTATTDGRTDGRTYERMDGRMDSPTFRTNWSHEILGEPNKDGAARLRKEDGEVRATTWTARERVGVEGKKVFARILKWVYANKPADISILTASLSML